MSDWKFDPMHLQVEFAAKHLGMMTVRGHFAEVTATGDIYPDQPERTKIEATINTASIRTHNEQRDTTRRVFALTTSSVTTTSGRPISSRSTSTRL